MVLKMRFSKVALSVIFGMVFAVSLVSAQLPNFEFLDFLDNSLIKFILVGALFFAMIFYSANRIFRDNRGVSAIIALVLSIFISSFILREGFVFGFFSGDLAEWLTLLAVLLGIGFLIFAMVRWLRGCIGITSALIVLWIVLRAIDPSDYLFGDAGQLVFDMHQLYTHIAVLSVLAIIFLICLIRRFGWRRGPRPPGPGPPGPPGPTPPGPGPTPTPPGRMDLIVLRPLPPGNFPAGTANVEFNFQFRNAPAGYRDRVQLFAAFGGGGFSREGEVRSGERGRIGFNLAPHQQANDVQFYITLVGRQSRVTSQRYGPYVLRGTGGGGGSGGGGGTGPIPPIRSATSRAVYDLKQKYVSYAFDLFRIKRDINKAVRYFQAMRAILNQVQSKGYDHNRFLQSKKNGGIGNSNAQDIEDYKDKYINTVIQKLIQNGKITRAEGNRVAAKIRGI